MTCTAPSVSVNLTPAANSSIPQDRSPDRRRQLPANARGVRSSLVANGARIGRCGWSKMTRNEHLNLLVFITLFAGMTL
ncbi:unnamed protein product [Acanthoscelides obtectus]|uniref:Uncharacterized protein n=1 Tax=Acanthoscelides obtectus TaxID=200917 RepID=A0A9P0L0A2_ACAOB|nr:unnamed protein product [Acanthoscelides obtectus]CAK1645273.1 hypothetical protein AOBTE_LOCUS14071 [Acanthoscelides obtectus]